MGNCELIMFLNALSITLAQGKTQEELAFLSLAFSQLSTNFALLAVKPPGCTNPSTNSTNETPPTSDDAIISTIL